MVAGSRMSQVSTSVGSAVNGSRNAVLASGSSTMSDSLMPFQPVIEEPSNILPSSNRLGSTIDLREGHVVLHAAHVGEAQVDELDLVVLDQLFDVFERHGDSGIGGIGIGKVGRVASAYT